MAHLLKCVEVDPHLVHFLLSELGFNPDYHYINVWFEQSLSTSIRSESKWSGVSWETFGRRKHASRTVRGPWVIISKKNNSGTISPVNEMMWPAAGKSRLSLIARHILHSQEMRRKTSGYVMEHTLIPLPPPSVMGSAQFKVVRLQSAATNKTHFSYLKTRSAWGQFCGFLSMSVALGSMF